MIPIIITLATITSYFTVGFTWSRRMLPKWWEIARREWRSYSWDDDEDSTHQRSSVKEQFFWKAVTWPVFLTIHTIDLDRVIDSGDPRKLEARLKERDRRIDELERELGMNR